MRKLNLYATELALRKQFVFNHPVGSLGLLWPSAGFEVMKLTLVHRVPRWEEKIPLAKTTLEKTWLFHEIGRCYLELDQPWQAQNYGEKSQQCAEEEGDIEWQLNASVLVAQAQGMSSERITLPSPTLGPSCHTGAGPPVGRTYHPSVSLLRLALSLRVGINPSILSRTRQVPTLS